MKAFFVYMMTNQSRVILYTGVTSNLTRRICLFGIFVWFGRSLASLGMTSPETEGKAW